MMRRSLLVAAALLLLLAAPALAQQGGGVTIYVVQRGDTLFRIAQQYGLTIADLAQINGLANPNSIDVGDRLLIPLENESLPPIHFVQPGETLEAIAGLYGLLAADLQALNQLEDASVYVGLALAIGRAPEVVSAEPAVVAEAPAVDTTSNVLHSVERGETLFRIAQGYGVTMNAIVEANGLSDPELIYPGQMLVIPGVEAPQLAAGLPALVNRFSVMPLSLLEGRTGEFVLGTTAPAAVTGTFLNQPLLFAADGAGTKHTALIGIPFGTAPGIYPVSVVVSDGTGQYPVSANVEVRAGNYQEGGAIRVTGDASVLLNEAVEQQEQQLISGLMSRFTPERSFDAAFGLPAAAAVTSGYGSVRTYNGDVQRVHTGTDFGGAPGTPVLAAAPGRIVMVDNLNIRGLATIIDHGWGVYTGYWHQSEAYVSPGDYVSEGQVIGAVGSSGRVSGPHLHWELWVNGVPVDPMQWVVQDFS